MSVIGPIKSLLFYSGTISVAGAYSGDKDVTIASAEPTKSLIMPAGGTNVTSSGVVAPTVAFTDGNLKWDYTYIPSSTVVRFKNVVNTDGNPHTITYAFWVVEYR